MASTNSASEMVYVEETKGINGLDKIVLREARGFSAEVYLYGGQVTSWKTNHGEELLFLNKKAEFRPPKTIRGGIQLSFPEFTSQPHERYGFAKNKLWTVDPSPQLPTTSTDKAFVDLILKHSEEQRWGFPHKEVRIEGFETQYYLDNLKNQERFTEQGNALTFEEEVDRVYLRTPKKVAIIDHARKKTYVLHKDGLPDAGVWNPGEKKAKALADLGNKECLQMVCVQPARTGTTLRPGQEWKGKMEMSLAHSSYHSGPLVPLKALNKCGSSAVVKKTTTSG